VSGALVSDPSTKRELNRGFGDALATAFELALTPAIVAFLGWRLDLWLGTTPLFLAGFFLFTMGYEIWKLFRRYEARMTSEAANIPGLRNPNGPAGDGKAGR
jgi:F0F1-type ATP synthase assembly protein I